MRSYGILTSAVLGIVLAASAVATADIETTVFTDADAWIHAPAPWLSQAPKDYNYGASTAMSFQSGNSTNKRPFMHFDLSALDKTKPVTGATLKVERASLNFNYGHTIMALCVMPEADD